MYNIKVTMIIIVCIALSISVMLINYWLIYVIIILHIDNSATYHTHVFDCNAEYIVIIYHDTTDIRPEVKKPSI